MPGSDLNLDLPTLSDTMADVVSKLVTAIETIEADLEPRVTAGELDISTNLSLGGAALTNVGGVRLTGGESTEVGTLYLHSDGEIYVVTSAGEIQLTADGAINIASVGTIGGDFGGANPAAVTYNDVAGEFRFTEDTGVWADLVGDDLILKSDSGSVRVGVDNAITTARTFNFKSLPASGVGGLAYDASNNALVDATVTRETVTHLFTSLNCSSTMTADVIKHGDQVLIQPITLFSAGYTTGAGLTANADTGYAYVSLAAGDEARIPLHGLRVGHRLKKIKVYGIDVGSFVPTFTITRKIGLSSSATHAFSGAADGSDAYEMTLSVQPTLAAVDTVWLRIQAHASGTYLIHFALTVDAP